MGALSPASNPTAGKLEGEVFNAQVAITDSSSSSAELEAEYTRLQGQACLPVRLSNAAMYCCFWLSFTITSRLPASAGELPVPDPLTILLATTLETASEAVEAHVEALKSAARLLSAFDRQSEPEVLALYRAQGGDMTSLPVEEAEREM